MFTANRIRRPDDDVEYRLDRCAASWRGGSAIGQERPLLRWEYTDLTVPIGWAGLEAWHVRVPDDDDPHSRRSRTRQDFAVQIDDIIRPHLERAAREGWEPAHPVDWEYLCRAGRVATNQGHGRWSVIVNTYECATIRLRRLVRAS